MYLDQPKSFGLSPRAPDYYRDSEILCKDGTYDRVAGIFAPCRYKGGEAIPAKYRPLPTKRNELTADQIIAQNAFLAKVAASKPKRRGLPPMAVRFR
jgi:hypothetical protein